MATYHVYIVDWDLVRIIDPSRELLFNITRKGKVADKRLYHRPYKLEADNLEHVFEILNIAHPRDYNRRSLSNGDIVVDETGTAWVCLPIGWEKARDFQQEQSSKTKQNSKKGAIHGSQK